MIRQTEKSQYADTREIGKKTQKQEIRSQKTACPVNRSN